MTIAIPQSNADWPAVEFPGPLPGAARVSRAGCVWTLRKSVNSVSWGTYLDYRAPMSVTNKLTGRMIDPGGRQPVLTL